MSLRYRYDKKGNVTGMGWGKGKNWEAGQKKLQKNNETARSTSSSKSSSTKKSKLKITPAHDNPGAAAAKEMARKRKKKGITFEQAKAKQDKDMRDAARKRHDEWQKKNKRGKYSDRAKKKNNKKDDKPSKYAARGTFRGI